MVWCLGKKENKHSQVEEEEELEKEEREKEKEIEERPKGPLWFTVFLSFLIFFLALIVRLYFLFFVSDPQNGGIGWYNDVYHHWQIGFLTREVGLSHGFLRLWDLKGMEFFWGPLHPLVLSLLFAITGSSDIIIPRLLSTISGAISCVLLFLLARRYFNLQVALAASFFAIFNPVGIFADASGMQEPLGIALLLAGIYFWPNVAFLTALFWGLAAMVRAEYWLFSLGLLFAAFVAKEKLEQKILLGFSYFVIIGVYAKYLLSWTGNAIYPIWWNFLGNAQGQWQAEIPLTTEQIFARFIFGAILAVSILGIIMTFWKKPRWYLLSLLGFGNLAFLAAFIGFTQYLKSYLPRFWVDRIFWLPYMFLGLLIAVIFLWWIPRLAPIISKIYFSWILWLFIAGFILASQLAWLPIWHYFNPEKGKGVLQEKFQLAQEVGSAYKGGAILIPEGDEIFTYALVKQLKLSGKNIVGQMFDPFYYIGEDKAFEDWNIHRESVLNWVRKENISLMVFNKDRERYLKLVEKEPEIFRFVRDIGVGIKIYEVRL